MREADKKLIDLMMADVYDLETIVQDMREHIAESGHTLRPEQFAKVKGIHHIIRTSVDRIDRLLDEIGWKTRW